MYPAALIFNAEGTIAETDELHRRAFNLSFRDFELGWHWSHAIYGRLIETTTTQSKILTFLQNYRPEEAFKLENGGLLKSVIERKNEHYLSMIESGAATLRPGVSRLIKEARVLGVRLGIASLGGRSDFECVLQNHFGIGALSNFDAIVTNEDIEITENSVENMSRIYSETARNLAVSPSSCVVIEAREAGAEAASALTFNVIVTPGLYTSSCPFPAADLVLSDLGHPTAPFHVIRGRADAHHFVSIDALGNWTKELAGKAA